MNNGYLMFKCLSLRSDQKYNFLVSAMIANLCLFLQQSLHGSPLTTMIGEHQHWKNDKMKNVTKVQ